jgi:hypothetical protein
MNGNQVEVELTEEKWGYFRPGYYPIKNNTVVPAIVCLSNSSKDEPNIQFVLVKTDCCLKEWQDALVVSEQDFNQAQAKFNTDFDINISDKIENLTAEFVAKGYLPLTKIKNEIKNKHFH